MEHEQVTVEPAPQGEVVTADPSQAGKCKPTRDRDAYMRQYRAGTEA